MKNAIAAIISAIPLPWALILSAQGTLYVSNLDQTPTGNAAAGSDYWIAQGFDIEASDSNLYTLDSIQLRLDPQIGSPSGFAVSLYNARGDAPPQDYLGSLTGLIEPSTGGIYTYTASDITIPGGASYYVVVSSSTPTNQGAFVWSASDSSTRSGSWVIGVVYYTSSDGSNWDRHVREEVFQMAIHATVVPEPTTLCLAGLGLCFLGLLRRSAQTTSSSGDKVSSPAPN